MLPFLPMCTDLKPDSAVLEAIAEHREKIALSIAMLDDVVVPFGNQYFDEDRLRVLRGGHFDGILKPETIEEVATEASLALAA